MTSTMRTLLVVSCHHFYDDILSHITRDSVYCAKSHSLGNEQLEGHLFFSSLCIPYFCACSPCYIDFFGSFKKISCLDLYYIAFLIYNL